MIIPRIVPTTKLIHIAKNILLFNVIRIFDDCFLHYVSHNNSPWIGLIELFELYQNNYTLPRKLYDTSHPEVYLKSFTKRNYQGSILDARGITIRIVIVTQRV